MSDDEDIDAAIAALEASNTTAALSSARLSELHSELSSARNTAPQDTYTQLLASTTGPLALTPGTLVTLPSEAALLDLTTQSTVPVVTHFFHPSFPRCDAMDVALQALARAHVEVRFTRLDALGADFLTRKLGVRVLPCVLGFVDGAVRARVTGFERVQSGSKEQVSVEKLERVLVRAGVLKEVRVGEEEGGASDEEAEGRAWGKIRQSKRGARGTGDADDDWD